MLTKAALALAIVGTVSAANNATFPRWISADKYGYGYVLSAYYNNTYNYEGSTSFSWDFDYNCIRSYWYSYSDYSWGESSYCNGYLKEDTSYSTCQQSYYGYYDLEAQYESWLADFTISWGAGYKDPVWGYDNYHVYEHKRDWTYLYVRPSDQVIEFIVDSNNYDADIVSYFPSGLTWDKTVSGVYDYELRYGTCANNASLSSFTKLFAPKVSVNKMAKPANNEKPRAHAAPAGGVKSLFHTASKAAPAAPAKSTFVVNKAQAAPSAPTAMFKNMKAEAKPATSSIKSMFKAAATSAPQASKLAQVKSYLKSYTDDSSLAQEIDAVFAIIDTNQDGYITPAEVRAAVIASGDQITDQELQMVYLLIDSN